MRISEKGIQELLANKRLRNRLAYELNKTSKTINLWIKENDVSLTLAQALLIISEETGLTNQEILEDVRAIA